jgi:hypothetical protein
VPSATRGNIFRFFVAPQEQASAVLALRVECVALAGLAAAKSLPMLVT